MEGTIIGVVLIYFVFICLDFAVPEIFMVTQGGEFTDEYQAFIINWSKFFWIIDLIFLSVFIVEITLRVYAWGMTYVKDWLNLLDAIIVFASFIMCAPQAHAHHGASGNRTSRGASGPPCCALAKPLSDDCVYRLTRVHVPIRPPVCSPFRLFATMQITMFESAGDDEGGSGIQSTLGILRVFRIVRIIRIVIILNKIKRSRDNAQMLRMKAKYKRQGSPVERVVEILQRLRRKAEKALERDNLSFIIDAVISDQLYTVSVSTDTGVDANMSAFLLEGGAQTKAQAKRTVLPVGGARGLYKSASKKDGKKGGRSARFAPDVKGGESAAESAEYMPPVPTEAAQATGTVAVTQNRRTSVGLHNSELAWVEQLQMADPVKRCLSQAHSWDFNVFELDRVCNRHPVVFLVLHIVQQFELENTLPINMDNLVRLLIKLEEGYNNVPFHNFVHAADVTHGTAYFLSQEVVARHVSPLDIYCMVIGAAMHDFNHPGFNNAFLVASRHDTAILYNDVSVLENFHIASSWRLMLNDDLNPFHGFTDEQYLEARQTMVYGILGTDMKFHFDHLTKFKTRLGAGAFEDPDRKDVRLLLAMCLHSADVSNPAKKWDLTVEWAARVMEEFFQQGEKEQELGLPVSPFMDRKKTDIGKCQSGFISILIKPFFDEWTQFLGESNRHIFQNVEKNIATWTEQGESALGDRVHALKADRPTK